MVFMCQTDSFLRQAETQVVSCDLVDDKSELSNAGIEAAKVPGQNVYRVVLTDSIIFPEGGGQPDDRGTINEIQTIRSIRKGTEALHYLLVDDATTDKGDCKVAPFAPGQSVKTEIDWQRRFDHMQQHSGQHLITAIADTLYGFPTTSWWLGSEESYIEMDTKDITDEQIIKIEDAANSKIRAAVPVSVDVVELDDPKLKNARGRNLPEDVKGQIRIVTMVDVESNVCCGTHVTNLSQLQVIKLLHVIKKKGKCLLHFLSGGRVIDRFSQQFRREQQLIGILKSNLADLPQAAEKINVALKNSRKSCQVLSKDLAALEAKSFSGNGNMSKFWAYHRDNVDLDFANALLRELGKDIVVHTYSNNQNNCVLLITVKTEDTSGHMMLVGGNLEKEKISNLGDRLCEILDGKGNVRGNVYQAKVNKINNVKKAVKLAKEFIDGLGNDKNDIESPEN